MLRLMIVMLCTVALLGAGCAKPSEEVSLEKKCVILVEHFIAAMQRGDYEEAASYATADFQSAEDMYSLLDRRPELVPYLKDAKVLGVAEVADGRQLFPEERWGAVEIGGFYTTHFRVEVSNGSLAVFPVPVIPEATPNSFVGESVMRDFNPSNIELVSLATSSDGTASPNSIAYELTFLNTRDHVIGDMSTPIAVAIEPRDELASLLREFDLELVKTESQRTDLRVGEEVEYLEVYTIQGEGLTPEEFGQIKEQATNVNVILIWNLTQEEITRFEP